MVPQDISRRALSAGVACEQDDASAAKRRNKEGAATVPCCRTIPYGVATGFLTSSSVHSSLSCERQGLSNAKSLRTPSPCEHQGLANIMALAQNNRAIASIWLRQSNVF